MDTQIRAPQDSFPPGQVLRLLQKRGRGASIYSGHGPHPCVSILNETTRPDSLMSNPKGEGAQNHVSIIPYDNPDQRKKLTPTSG